MKQLKTIGNRIYEDVKNYIGVIVIVGVYYLIVRIRYGAFCPLLLLTGIPCAGCGMTRSVFFILTAQFGRAFYLNPLSILIVLFGLYCFFWRYIKGSKVKGFVTGVGIICVLLLVLYVWRMYVYFPHRVPYVYREQNLLGNLIPGYKNVIYRYCGG